jgi:PAS domain S-box-containing protein/excisionase family DNA binding protein
MDDKEKLLTIQQASSLLGLNAGTLRHWAQENKVQAFKVGTRGDWRFKKEDLQEIIKKHGEENYNISNKYSLISKFLISNANSIQKHATYLHKKFLGSKKFRTEYLNKYQKDHIKIVKEIANNLHNKKVSKGTEFFNKFGEDFGRDAIKDGLTIEETVDGIIFLKQAVWDKLKKKGLLKTFTALEMFDINQVVGTYCDVVASRIAFTYHEYYKHDALKAEEKLVVSERRYRTMIEQSPLSMQVLSVDGKTLIVNKAWEDLWGAKLEQMEDYNILRDKQLSDLGIMPYIKKGFNGESALIPAVKLEPNKSVKNLTKISYRWIKAFVYPVKDERGSILEVVLVHEDITEQKKAEEALRESEEKFRTLAEAIPQIVYVADTNGEPEYFNKRWYEYIGKGKALGWMEAIHPEDQLTVIKKWNISKKSETPFEAEYRLRGFDDKYLWFLGRSVPIKNKKGKIVNWFGTATEIESFKQAKRTAEFESQKLHTLFMQAPAMIAVANGPNLVYELANPLYLKSVGKTRDIIGKPVLEVFPELKGQDVLNILFDVYKTGKPYSGKEVPVKLDINNDGKAEDVYFNFTYQVFRDGQGKVAGIMTHAVDVTDMVNSRRKIEEAEEKFRTLADNIPNLAWMANPDGYIFWYNSRWYEYTGTKPEQMEGWGWQAVHDPKALPEVLEKWKKSVEKGITFEMVFPIKGADGEFRPFLTRVVPIRDRGNHIVRWFGTNTDITKQIELEKQKDEFLGIASHELKTPVTSIKAYTQVLERLFQRNGDIKSAEMLSKMGVQVDKLSNLIGDLLDVTKIRSGRIKFHEEYFDFNELVQQIVEELQLTTDKHEIVKEFSATRTIFGDRDRIGQVISNLISNAIKYSPKSSKIIVKTEANHDNITLCVQDFGIGIPKEKQGKVFEQFFRVSGEREITFPGLGLGLYVSSQIIQREGGKIWVNSIRGKGSSFYFSLPLPKGK